MSVEQRLKGLVYSDTKKICREVGVYLNVEYEPESLDVIGELVWKKLQSFALDLEAFQKHAKRATITVDDVKLLIRKNDSLKVLVEDKCKQLARIKVETRTSGTGKRKRKTSSSAD